MTISVICQNIGINYFIQLWDFDTCHARDMHQYLRAGWRNWSQSFGKWQVWSLTIHWNHFGFLISIPGVRNVLQSQEEVPDFQKIKIKFFNVSRCFGGFRNFFFLFFFRDHFWKSDWQNFGNLQKKNQKKFSQPFSVFREILQLYIYFFFRDHFLKSDWQYFRN